MEHFGYALKTRKHSRVGIGYAGTEIRRGLFVSKNRKIRVKFADLGFHGSSTPMGGHAAYTDPMSAGDVQGLLTDRAC